LKNNLNVVCPDYLCEDTLPYAADIFYHENLVYCMPIGISQTEWENVIEFPRYCAEGNIALPQIIWEMQSKYFECSKQAVECSKILEPLGKRVLKVSTVYARDLAAITSCREKLRENPSIQDAFMKVACDLNFLTRELFSHVFFEIYLEGGFGLVKEYLEKNLCNAEEMFELMCAVVTNRIYKVFDNDGMKYIVYNHSWYPYLKECFKRMSENDDSQKISDIDPNIYRLFVEIVTPIFGRCDSNKKTTYIATVAEKQKDAILGLKNVCKEIVEESIFCVNDEIDLRDKKMKDMISNKVIEPLSYMMSRPQRDVKQLITDFILDSTVIGGALSITQGFDYNTVGVAAGAGAISVGLKYITSEKGRKIEPTRFLLEGLKRNKMDYLNYEKNLQQITFNHISMR